MKTLNRYSWALMLIFPTTFLNATKLYIIPDVYVAAWKVGVLDDRTQSTSSGYNMKFPGKIIPLYSAGLHSTLLLSGDWAITAGGSAGYASTTANLSLDAKIGPSPYAPGCSGFACNVTNYINISSPQKAVFSRQEVNLALSKALGRSGFSIFLGSKYQRYTYDGSDDTSIMGITGNYALTVAPFSTGATTPSSQAQFWGTTFLSQAAGPAAGLGYAFRLGKSLQLTTQASLLTLFGQISMDDTNVKLSAVRSTTSHNDTNYIAYGFTGLVSIVKPITYSGFLQFSLRGQYYQMKVTKTEGWGKNPISQAIEPGPTDTSNSIFNNAVDYIGGIQIAYIQQITGD